MDFIINLLAFVFALGIIVSIHELGHLIMAKRAGMLCYEYSIGLGPAIYKRKGKETDFAIRAIPIGGYVSIAGEQMSTEMIKKGQTIGLNFKDGKVIEMVLYKGDFEKEIQVVDFEIYAPNDEPLFIAGYVDGKIENYPISEEAIYKLPKQEMKIAPYKRCFESKTYLEKLLTLLAGPVMNFILAILLFFLVASFTGAPVNSNKIGGVMTNNPANIAGIEKGDIIESIDGNEVTNWEDIGKYIIKEKSYDIKLAGKSEVIKINPRIDITQLGISNYYFDEETKEVTIYQDAIIGTSYGLAEDIFKNGDQITKFKYEYKNITLEEDVNSFQDIIDNLDSFDGGTLEVTFLRDGKEETKTITVWEKQVLKSQGVTAYDLIIGITPVYKYNFVHTITYPFKQTFNSFYQVLMVLKFLFGGSKQVGIKQLSGPVGIFNIVGLFAREGVLSLLSFIGFLSVNIGVLNLLPIPALDGGRIVFISIEGVTRKKIPRKTENLINNVFFILLMLLFVYVTFNDILRLF
ncbi:MAG: RIP metalloprotease RseP [Acholeplasmataceae bacterium]